MARRIRGEGSVYQRKDGYHVAQYKGQYRYAKTQKDAKKKLLELIKAGEVHKPDSKTTVAAYMDRWIAFAEQNLKPATIKRYKEAIEIHIKPNLGDRKLHKQDAISVQDMYAQMQQSGLSAATVNLVHSVLSSALKRAVKWGVLHHNTIENVEAPGIHRTEVEVFTPQEVQALLSAASGDRLQALYFLALSTGMRWWGVTRARVETHQSRRWHVGRGADHHHKGSVGFSQTRWRYGLATRSRLL
jgi:integrase